MRLLFVKHSLGWPRSNGHDVGCYYMMKELSALGAEVSLVTVEEVDPRAVDGISLAFCGRLSAFHARKSRSPITLTTVQKRFCSYWGIEIDEIQSVKRAAVERRADVVIAYGLTALPYLAGVDSALRVWSMADEWVLHFMAQVRLTNVRSWRNIKTAMIHGLYERAFQPVVDRVWSVSETDRRAARWFAGMRVGDLLPHGVDADYYRPTGEPEIPASAVFWGRLDFAPNVEALKWFCRRIWPEVRREVPDAHFTIIGYDPTTEVKQLAEVPGVSIRANLADLRSAVCEHGVVVLPFLSAGGIKNKLLEGAALARPIVCTPQACQDLHADGPLPLISVESTDAWVRSLVTLWGDARRRAELGARARSWVIDRYSWAAPARNALETFRTTREVLRPLQKPATTGL
jgi:glycosyltransferase involved in cell wall biosynthesis